jgi:exopolysaccharide production protein ExoZ
VKLNSVQYLRASAIAFVVGYHASDNLGAVSPHYDFLEFGQYGVDLFFVISGFIIMVTTTSESSPTIYIAKRLWRIVPLYWLVTLVYVCILLLAPDLLRSGVLDFGYIVKSFLFIPSYDPQFQNLIWPLVVPGWSLNYEMYFYALFSISLLAAKYRWCAASAILLLLIGFGQIINTSDPIVITYTNTLLVEFVFGIIAGAVFLNSNAAATKLLSLAFLFIAITAAVCVSHGIAVWRGILCGSTSGAILSLLLAFERSGTNFSNVILIAIGDASYSIYLTHAAFISLLRRIADSLQINEANSAEMIAALVVALVGSSLVGWLIFVHFERRVMSWGSIFFRRKLTGINDVAPTAAAQ